MREGEIFVFPEVKSFPDGYQQGDFPLIHPAAGWED